MEISLHAHGDLQENIQESFAPPNAKVVSCLILMHQSCSKELRFKLKDRLKATNIKNLLSRSKLTLIIHIYIYKKKYFDDLQIIGKWLRKGDEKIVSAK